MSCLWYLLSYRAGKAEKEARRMDYGENLRESQRKGLDRALEQAQQKRETLPREKRAPEAFGFPGGEAA